MLSRTLFQLLGVQSKTDRNLPRWTDFFYGVFLLFCVGFAYLPALHGGMLWDDAAHVISSDLSSLTGLRRVWTELGATQQYYPTLYTMFWIEHRLWGDAVIGYHAVNFVLHACSALLLGAVLTELRVKGAAFAALLFALHPVCVESVAWISEQKNTLSLVFYLAAALVYLKFEHTRSRRHYLSSLGLFLLAISTKSVTATLPAALLVVIWWRRGSLRWARDWRPLLPWILVGMGAGFFTAWVERTIIGAAGAAYDLTIWMRFLLAGRAASFYLGKLIWPVDLIFIYPRWTIDPAQLWQWVFPLAWGLALIVLYRLRPRARGLFAGLFLYGGTLLPALGFFNVYPFVYSYVADHFQYHASLAFLALVAALWARWDEREGAHPRLWRRFTPKLVAVATLLILSVQTYRQSRQYVDVETLYRTTIERNPDCVLAHNNLGMIYALRGDSAAAITHFKRALEANPNFAEAEDNLGGELAKLPGREREAVEHFEAALRIHPDFPMALLNLANQLALIPDRRAESERHFLRVLALEPKYAKAYNDFAIWLGSMTGRHSEALNRYEAALQLNPDYALARANYAFELSREPLRRSEALAQYTAALLTDPALVEAHNNLANLLAPMPGRQLEAISHYESALRLNPRYAEAHNNLANQLITIPARAAEALSHYEQAVSIRPDYVEALNNLAIAYANAGRLGDAERHFRLAIKFAPNFQAARDNLRLLLAPNL